ncbi:hypothetical protein D3C81_1732940 [compost metagenome]
MRCQGITLGVGACCGCVFHARAGGVGYMDQRVGLAEIGAEHQAIAVHQGRAAGVDRQTAVLVAFKIAGTEVGVRGQVAGR